MDFLDLIHDGVAGLITGIHGHDPKKINPETGQRYKVLTYATWWIQQNLSRQIINTADLVRKPVYYIEGMHKVNKAIKYIIDNFGKEPSEKEISKETGLSTRQIRNLKKRNRSIIYSLDAEINAEEGTIRYGELIEDKRVDVPWMATLSSDYKEKIQEAVNRYLRTKRERGIIRMRFGLDGKPPRTLEEISTYYGVTRERIRQIEGKLLEKLRWHIRSFEGEESIEDK